MLQLNCDLGEGYGIWSLGDDQAIMPLINSANIACGGHASDPIRMQAAVKLAQQHKVEIVAHPSYPDIQGFGRRSIPMSSNEISALLTTQIGALAYIAHSENTFVKAVKPHGALYNDMMRDTAIFDAIVSAISKLPLTPENKPLELVILATANNAAYQHKADEYGITLRFEAFADRNYQANGQLVPRSQPNAVIHDDTVIKQRIANLAKTGQLTSMSGEPLALNANTLCVHSDTPGALHLAKQLRELLDALSQPSDE